MADTKISAESSAGTLDGAEIVPVVRGAGSPVAYTNHRSTALEIARLGGLFAPVMSVPRPTIANTGLASWINQNGAAVADNAMGMSISVGSAGGGARVRYKPAPTPPYTITAYVAIGPAGFANFFAGGIGFTDGTKLQTWDISQRNTVGPPALQVNNHTNATTFASTAYDGGVVVSFREWLRIADDGTNVIFSWSADGVNFTPRYSVAKASGFLGAAGYTNVFFYLSPSNFAGSATLLSWAQE